MPHSNTLFHRLVELRRCYIGETDSALVPAICAGTLELTKDDRALLLDSLAEQSALPERLKQAVLPDAASAAQRELEAATLAALSHAVHFDGSAPSSAGIRRVRPARTHLLLHLPPELVGPLVQNLMPAETDDGFTGYPGLRACASRRHVELSVLGTDAKLFLSHVFWGQWREASVDRWLGDESEPLTPCEEDALARRACAPPHPAHLGSALLRRIGLFPELPLIMTTTGLCYLNWANGPEAHQIVERLLHPIAGIAAASGHHRAGDRDVLTTDQGRLVVHRDQQGLPARLSGQPLLLGAEPAVDQPKRPEM